MSYELAIINPRRKRKKASAAQLAARRRFVAKFAKGRKSRRKRKSASSSTQGVTSMAKRRKRRSPARSAKGRFVKKSHRRHKAKAAAPRRRRRRSSAGKRHPVMGYTVGSRRIRRRKLNPRASRRRRYHRNPFGLPSVGGIVGQLKDAAFGASGGLALNLALSYLPLPDSLKTGWPRHAVRVAGAIGLGMVAKKFLGAKGNAVAAGAMTIVVYDVLKQLIGQFAPEIGGRLGEFEDVSLSGDDFYSPASYVNGVAGYLDGDGSPGDGDVDGASMGAYMEGDLDGVGAYMEGGDL